MSMCTHPLKRDLDITKVRYGWDAKRVHGGEDCTVQEKSLPSIAMGGRVSIALESDLR